MEGYDYEEEEHNSQDVEPDKEQEEVAEAKVAKIFTVPESKAKLLACEKCRLIKTENQWKTTNFCENCKHSMKENDYKKHTSAKFEGMATIIDTNKSWLRRKLHLGKNIVSGLYAVELL